MKCQGLKVTYLIIPNIADLASNTSNHAMFSGNSIKVNLKLKTVSSAKNC